jgi:hypothetical protein
MMMVASPGMPLQRRTGQRVPLPSSRWQGHGPDLGGAEALPPHVGKGMSQGSTEMYHSTATTQEPMEMGHTAGVPRSG